jgi:hypothetical protein
MRGNEETSKLVPTQPDSISLKTKTLTMKVILACFLIALAYTANAWIFSKEAVPKAVSIASVTAAISMDPLAADAADFAGSYADPNHPNCLRVISVSGVEAILTGTDGNPGCPPDGSGEAWRLMGKVDGNSIFVDFSPKGGPPGLKGIWDDSAPAGIKWPDGNKWTLKGN